jgi:hypothetical protein
MRASGRGSSTRSRVAPRDREGRGRGWRGLAVAGEVQVGQHRLGDRDKAQLAPSGAAKRREQPGYPDGDERRADYHKLEWHEPGPSALSGAADVAGHGQLWPTVLLLPNDIRESQHHRSDRPAGSPAGPDERPRTDHDQVAAITPATKPTWGLASTPAPTTTPAARTQAPLPRTTARIINQPRAVVLNRSKLVVVTKCPTASANPDEAVQAAARICARDPPPTSRATSAARIVVAPATTADGLRSSRSDPGASGLHRPAQQRHERGLVGIAERGMRPGDDEVQLVAVISIPHARREQHHDLSRGNNPDPAAQTAPRRRNRARSLSTSVCEPFGLHDAGYANPSATVALRRCHARAALVTTAPRRRLPGGHCNSRPRPSARVAGTCPRGSCTAPKANPTSSSPSERPAPPPRACPFHDRRASGGDSGRPRARPRLVRPEQTDSGVRNGNAQRTSLPGGALAQAFILRSPWSPVV